MQKKREVIFSHAICFVDLFCRYLFYTFLDAQDFEPLSQDASIWNTLVFSIKIMRKWFLCIIYLLSQRCTTISSEIFSKKRLDKVPRFVFLLMMSNLKAIKLKSELFSILFNKKKHALNGIP